MNWIEVLVEGSSDVPVIREILTRKFSLVEAQDFRIHPHQGKGKLPKNITKYPELQNRSLLHQLPAKLRGFGSWFTKERWVLVVVDADETPFDELLSDLQNMLNELPKAPRVLFCIAVEETESWFIADITAVKKAYPKSNINALRKIKVDEICGAWEKLAEAIQSNVKDKIAWAEAISPHLNLNNPPSPSLQRLVDGVTNELSISANIL